jgi:tRNA-splicing endonuclease subunit Sen34
MEIVGGGRLGTGVKKAFLIGGAKPEGEQRLKDDDDEEEEENGSSESVRTFSIEWAVM